MYGCKSWTIKKAERWRIDAFELWCWRRLMRVPWTAWRSSQYILKEISPGCSLEHWCWSWNSNTLTWCEELTKMKRPWCWERLSAGREGDNRGWDGWMASLTYGFGWTLGVGDGQEGLACCSSWVTQSQTRLSDWTDLIITNVEHLFFLFFSWPSLWQNLYSRLLTIFNQVSLLLSCVSSSFILDINFLSDIFC